MEKKLYLDPVQYKVGRRSLRSIYQHTQDVFRWICINSYPNDFLRRWGGCLAFPQRRWGALGPNNTTVSLNITSSNILVWFSSFTTCLRFDKYDLNSLQVAEEILLNGNLSIKIFWLIGQISITSLTNIARYHWNCYNVAPSENFTEFGFRVLECHYFISKISAGRHEHPQ